MLRFFQQNGGFLSKDIKSFKDFQDFFQNIKIGMDLSTKSSSGIMPEKIKMLLNEAERLKKLWQERNMPSQELKLENDRLLEMIENILKNNLFIDKNSEPDFQNILKENILNLEKMLEKAQYKNSDYEKFIENLLDGDDGNEGFKKTLKSLIEYKKKADGINGLEDEIRKLQNENDKRNLNYLANFELIEKWLKRHKDVFKDCENVKLSIDIVSGISLMERNLKYFSYFY